MACVGPGRWIVQVMGQADGHGVQALWVQQIAIVGRPRRDLPVLRPGPGKLCVDVGDRNKLCPVGQLGQRAGVLLSRPPAANNAHVPAPAHILLTA